MYWLIVLLCTMAVRQATLKPHWPSFLSLKLSKFKTTSGHRISEALLEVYWLSHIHTPNHCVYIVLFFLIALTISEIRFFCMCLFFIFHTRNINSPLQNFKIHINFPSSALMSIQEQVVTGQRSSTMAELCVGRRVGKVGKGAGLPFLSTPKVLS